MPGFARTLARTNRGRFAGVLRPISPATAFDHVGLDTAGARSSAGDRQPVRTRPCTTSTPLSSPSADPSKGCAELTGCGRWVSPGQLMEKTLAGSPEDQGVGVGPARP